MSKKFEISQLVLYCGRWEETLKYINCDLILTSPPYNIGSDGPKKVGFRKLGLYDPKSFGGINDEVKLSEKTYQLQQKTFLEWCERSIKNERAIVYNHKLRHRKKKIIHPMVWFPDCLDLYEEIIWNRKSTHNHNKNYLYQHDERLYVLKKSNCKSIYFKNEGYSTIWTITPDRKNPHTAPYPLDLARRIIRLYCPPNGLVCDPYSGSGTTMLACLIENRKFVGTEINPKYFRMTKRRITQALKNNNYFLNTHK